MKGLHHNRQANFRSWENRKTRYMATSRRCLSQLSCWRPYVYVAAELASWIEMDLVVMPFRDVFLSRGGPCAGGHTPATHSLLAITTPLHDTR